MNKEEKKILEDFKAFIDFCIENDKSLFYVLGNLGHDIGGLIREDKNFLPRTHDYSKKKE